MPLRVWLSQVCVVSSDVTHLTGLTSKATGQTIGCASGPRNTAGSQESLESRTEVVSWMELTLHSTFPSVPCLSMFFSSPPFLFSSQLSSSLLLQLIYLFNIPLPLPPIPRQKMGIPTRFPWFLHLYPTKSKSLKCFSSSYKHQEGEPD